MPSPNLLVWSINNNSLWDGFTVLFLAILARPLWRLANNDRIALFIVASKTCGELFSVFLIFILECAGQQFQFFFLILIKYCHTLVYFHTFMVAFNRAHLILAPIHYFDKVDKKFIFWMCSFAQILPILVCYPAAKYEQIWKYCIEAGLGISFAIYAFIIAKMLWQKWNGKYTKSVEKDHSKIFACCLCTLLPLMCSHFTSGPLRALFSDPAEQGDQITLNQVFLFLLNISNNFSTIGDEICLLILCKELRKRVADQFRIGRCREASNLNSVQVLQQNGEKNNSKMGDCVQKEGRRGSAWQN